MGVTIGLLKMTKNFQYFFFTPLYTISYVSILYVFLYIHDKQLSYFGKFVILSKKKRRL